MVRPELVRYIKEQMHKGRDALSIRNYLMSQNVDFRSIDQAFDKVYGEKKGKSNVALIGVIFLFVIFIGFGSVYVYNLSVAVDTNPILEQPVERIPSVCNQADVDQRYDCFYSKISIGEIQCHQILNPDDRDLCYLAQDAYVLESEV